jgi:hypothetical protein
LSPAGRYRLAGIGLVHEIDECFGPTQPPHAFAAALTGETLSTSRASAGSFSQGCDISAVRSFFAASAAAVGGGGRGRVNADLLFASRFEVLQQLETTATRKQAAKGLATPEAALLSHDDIQQAIQLALSDQAQGAVRREDIGTDHVDSMINILLAGRAIVPAGKKQHFCLAPKMVDLIVGVAQEHKLHDPSSLRRLATIRSITDLVGICLNELWPDVSLCLVGGEDRLRMVARTRPLMDSHYAGEAGAAAGYLRLRAIADGRRSVFGRSVDLADASEPANPHSLERDREEFILPEGSDRYRGEVFEGVGADSQGKIRFEFEVSRRLLRTAPALAAADQNPWLKMCPPLGMRDSAEDVAAVLHSQILRPLADRISEVAGEKDLLATYAAEEGDRTEASLIVPVEDRPRLLSADICYTLDILAHPRQRVTKSRRTQNRQVLTEYTLRNPLVLINRARGVDAWASIIGTVFNDSFLPTALTGPDADMSPGIDLIRSVLDPALYAMKLFVDEQGRLVAFAMLHLRMHPDARFADRRFAEMSWAGAEPSFMGLGLADRAYGELLTEALADCRASGMQLWTGTFTPNPSLFWHIWRALRHAFPYFGREGVPPSEQENFEYLQGIANVISNGQADATTLVQQRRVIGIHRAKDARVPWSGVKRTDGFYRAHVNLANGDLPFVGGQFTAWTLAYNGLLKLIDIFNLSKRWRRFKRSAAG